MHGKQKLHAVWILLNHLRGTKSSSAVKFSRVARKIRGILTFYWRKHKVEVLLSISIFWFTSIWRIFTDFRSLEKKQHFESKIGQIQEFSEFVKSNEMKQIRIRADKEHFYDAKKRKIKEKGLYLFILKKNSIFAEICKIKNLRFSIWDLKKYFWGASPLKRILQLSIEISQIPWNYNFLQKSKFSSKWIDRGLSLRYSVFFCSRRKSVLCRRVS